MKRGTMIASALLLFAAPAAWGGHDEYRRVQTVAHELEKAAGHVHREAERRRHHFDRYEAAALVDLHELEERAAHFHHQVERHARDPHHTERDYLELRRAYFRAAESLHDLHALRHVERDFQRVSILMRELDRFYGVGHYGYGRYGRGHERPRYDHKAFPRWFLQFSWRD